MTKSEQREELGRLRNRHVAKILTYLGPDTPPYLEVAIKKAMSMFHDDVWTNILNDNQNDNQNDNMGNV